MNSMATAHKYDRVAGCEHVNVANGTVRAKAVLYTFMIARFSA